MKILDLQISGVEVGFITAEGKVYLQRCPFCKLENYAPAVSSGMCAWCGATIKLTVSKRRVKRVKKLRESKGPIDSGGGIPAAPLSGLPGDPNGGIRS